MKSITFDELPWFSFDDRFTGKKDLTIWQSVALIMSITDSDDINVIYEYAEKLTHIEADSADELFLLDDSLPVDASINSKFKPDRIEVDLRLLDQNREQVVDYFGGAFSVIYDLLLMEIQKLNSGIETPLAIKEKNISGYQYYLFGKGSLMKWKSIELLNELGLLEVKPRRRTKSSTEENHEKIAGMLLHLLINQPLCEGDKPVDFSWGDKAVSVSKVYNYFIKNYLDDTKDSNFPNTKTVSDYIKKAHRRFLDDIHLKARP